MFAAIFVLVACILAAASAASLNVSLAGSYQGVDVSTLTSSSTASCYVSSGISFIIPRGYKSSGAVDTNVCQTLINAKSAGIPHRDVSNRNIYKKL